MAGEKHVDLPDDLDALLRRTMSVDPSPSFLPRVRARIEVERSASISIWRLLVAAGAAAALLFIAVSVRETDAPLPAVPQSPLVRTAAPIPAIVAPKAEALPEAAPVRVASAAVRRSPAAAVSEVIVDERQRSALRTMMQMVSRGDLTGEAFEQTVPQSMQPIGERVAGIVVVPVAVSPIAIGGVLQGAEPKQPPRPAEAGFSRP